MRACVHTDLRPNHGTNAGKRNCKVGTYVILCEGGALQYIHKKRTGEAVTHIESVNVRSAQETL